MSRPRDLVKMPADTPIVDLKPIVIDGSGRNRPKVSPTARAKVFARDGNRCRHCGSTENLTIDHVKPLSKGGRNRQSNMQCLCDPCNQEKGDRT